MRLATVLSGEYKGENVCILSELRNGDCKVDRGMEDNVDKGTAWINITELRIWTAAQPGPAGWELTSIDY